MKTYLMQNDDYPLDVSLINSLDSISIKFETIPLPGNHNEVAPLLRELEGGIVFFPAIWEDLACVKMVQEISVLSTPFETVIVDVAPEASNLAVAFNEGLSAYLEKPVTNEKLKTTVSRARSGLEKRISHIATEQRLANLASQSVPINQSRPMTIRDQHLGKAFIDVANKTGPLFKNEVKVLLVSSSSVQQKQLEATLKAIGVSTTNTGNIEEAIQVSGKKAFVVVISDGVLPDGDAISLANRLRKTSKRMPHIIVWSSSPEKAATFLKPENHIDEVLMKPDPETGIESILPSIIAVVYRV